MAGYLLVDCRETAESCRVVQRSSEPLLLPNLPWELQGACTGMGTSDALQRLESPGDYFPPPHKNAHDHYRQRRVKSLRKLSNFLWVVVRAGPGERFLLHYDAADMRVGAALISVDPSII